MANQIAATTAAATSPDFIVTTPLKISCFGANGGEFVGVVMEKHSDGSYTPLRNKTDSNAHPVQVHLDGVNTAELIQAPGTYRFIKSATTGTVGVDTDS